MKYVFKGANCNGISDAYVLSSNFGVCDGDDSRTKETENGFLAEWEQFTVEGSISERNGVTVRRDTVCNTSEELMTVTDYQYRFYFPGSEYEVYTQFNGWQNESCGAWQPLVTTVRSENFRNRMNDNATPFLALWNRQANRGVAFHLLPEHGWTLSVSRRMISGKYVATIVEIGVLDRNLHWELESGERKPMSEVWYYSFENKLNFDSYKLHKRFLEEYPRREIPVIYNTWFCDFGQVDVERTINNIEEAAQLGCEYFVLDAGWYGCGAEWGASVGDWTENLTTGYRGNMKKVSDLVRKSGMKFGLWIEAERGGADSHIVARHPEYFFKSNNTFFLDFANEDAVQYIIETTMDLIQQYHIEFIKFDFNASTSVDRTGQAFYEYHRGQLRYVQALRKAYPNLYLENCASGGLRMNLEQMKYFDSFWISDDQSPYSSLRIFKDTVHRMPPCGLEKWAAMVSRDGFIRYGVKGKVPCTMAAHNATWSSMISLTPEYLNGFFAGGPVGITCDLTQVNAEFKESLKSFITEYKDNREFWRTASARVLTDTERVFIVQYETDRDVVLVVYTYLVDQTELTVYPALPEGKYETGGETYDREQGMTLSDLADNCAYFVSFHKKD